MKDLDVIIAVRDRDNKRIQNCINSVYKRVNKVFVVDYGSKKPVNVKNAKIIRYTGSKIWNKSHALNLGIKKSKSKYIGTIDCDMILNDVILDEIEKKLDDYTLIVNTNVRRIETKNVSKDYKKMITNSKSWFKEGSQGNIYSAANGGIQFFPRKWINDIGGYDEGIGVYWGAMDNRIFEQAKGTGMSIIDLNIIMLHQEHKKTKESNLDKEERDFAQYVRAFKIEYLKDLIKSGSFISKRPWGGKKPNHDWLLKLVKEWEKNLIPQAKICLAIISNYENVPTYFMLDVMSMIAYAKAHGIECLTFSMKGAGIDGLRNTAVEYAKAEGCTHILQLDTDHRYPRETIVKLLSHRKKFVCGVTTKRVPPFTFTQFKDANQIPINTPENECKFTKRGGLVKIGSTGMVGSLIWLGLFDEIKKPYYEFKRIKKNGKYYSTGEDVSFCRKLSKKGIDIWCDTDLSYPHQITSAFSDRGRFIVKA